VFKDLPASVLLRSLPKIALYNWGALMAGRRDGYAGKVLRAFVSFLGMIPGTLRKRWGVQRRREVAPAAFASQVSTEYPFPSRIGRLL
jgi:hypothetical protein